MESYIKTNDYQCWRISENKDIPVDLNMKEVDWKPEHYVSLEKNALASSSLTVLEQRIWTRSLGFLLPKESGKL